MAGPEYDAKRLRLAWPLELEPIGPEASSCRPGVHARLRVTLVPARVDGALGLAVRCLACGAEMGEGPGP